MGIKLLNRFLTDNCSKRAIKRTHLSQLTGKSIVVDTSIYLYKFAENDALIKNMTTLINILKHHCISPLFIFDGKAPPEKRELLIQRRIQKKEAEEQYNLLKLELEQNPEPIIAQKIANEMNDLKHKFVRIRQQDIINVKQLFDTSNVPYRDAIGEADTLCAHLVNAGKAWACLTDDMDMFVYGCQHVLRNINLQKQTLTHYDMSLILHELQMNLPIFKQIMVFSGSDYNINTNHSIHNTIQLYYTYRKTNRPTNNSPAFYTWLLNSKNIEMDEYEKIMTAYNMFDLTNFDPDN